MADQEVISQMQARIDHLEELVAELTNKIAKQAVTMTAVDAVSGSQSTSVDTSTIADDESSMLMKLPTELRSDIVERVMLPVFDARPYGRSKSYKFPAVLHVNRTIRAESIRVNLDLTRTKIADCKRENKNLCERHSNMDECRSAVARRGPQAIKRQEQQYAMLIANMKRVSGRIEENEMDIKDLESASQLLNGE